MQKFFIPVFVCLSLLMPTAMISVVYASSHVGVGPQNNTSVGVGPQNTQTQNQPQSVSLKNPLGDKTLLGLFDDLLNVVLVFAVPVIVFFIIYAGFLYVTARGNPEAIGQAHKALLYAIIGGVLILGAKVLLSVIKGTVTAIAS